MNSSVNKEEDTIGETNFKGKEEVKFYFSLVKENNFDEN